MPPSKRVKRQIRELAAKVEEMELRDALQPLAAAFKQWEAGDVDSFDLKDRIHRFHQGPAREIYVRFATPHLEPHVAYAIAAGQLDRSEVPAEVLAELEHLIEFATRSAEEEQPEI